MQVVIAHNVQKQFVNVDIGILSLITQKPLGLCLRKTIGMENENRAFFVRYATTIFFRFIFFQCTHSIKRSSIVLLILSVH